MGIDKGGLKRRRREASSPPRVTVTVGSSTRINMNSMEEVEEEEDKVGLDGTHSLPNLSLLRAEARARRPHMGTSRYQITPYHCLQFQNQVNLFGIKLIG